jgi:glycogen operon protein
MIFHCLRHWVHNYHVDGFRFDLASILSRDRNGELVPNPPLVETIAEDPQLADTKIIAEAWDAAGAYQVGSFANLRWAEWNGRYRDDVRRFWRGDSGMRGAMATRISGSSDLYEPGGRRPYHSINFITSHDGFTLNDHVSYCDKHNEANGEGNRDGDNNNFSCNYGVEGPTDDPHVARWRLRHIKNHLATLMLSQGVPMVVAGDEVRRTQQGNNNAYCQDNEISWFDWTLIEKNLDLLRFAQTLIRFRRDQPTVRRRRFLRGQPTGRRGLLDVNWYNADGKEVEWDGNGHRSLVCLLAAPGPEDDPDGVARDLLIMMNAADEPEVLTMPTVARGASWRLFVDTAADSPQDVFPNLDGPRPPATGKINLPERTLKCYVSTQWGKKASRHTPVRRTRRRTAD